MLFWRSIHATVISIVERPAAHRLRRLSCQLWVSLQAQCREQESCLRWTAELLPACSLALVSGPVISVSGPSRQPTRTPASQRRARPERDRCQKPAVPPPPPSHARPGRCLLRPGHIFEAEQHGKKGHLCHPFTVAVSQETGALSERSCQIWSIHQRRLSQSKSITDWDWVLTDWHADWQLYCVLWGTGMKGSHEEAAQTQTILSRAREELLVPLYALLFLCIESTSFSWQHSFSNCTKAAMEESDMLYSDYKGSAPRTRESGISRGILVSLLRKLLHCWGLKQCNDRTVNIQATVLNDRYVLAMYRNIHVVEQVTRSSYRLLKCCLATFS